jgi:hypothetical protein
MFLTISGVETEFRTECGKLYYLFLNNLLVADEPMLLSEALTLSKQILTVSDGNPITELVVCRPSRKSSP